LKIALFFGYFQRDWLFSRERVIFNGYGLPCEMTLSESHQDFTIHNKTTMVDPRVIAAVAATAIIHQICPHKKQQRQNALLSGGQSTKLDLPSSSVKKNQPIKRRPGLHREDPEGILVGSQIRHIQD
jgi:hypothetical protein